MWQCSQQHDNREEAKFCSKCGEKRETRVYCPECGSLLEPGDMFCTSCGHPRDTEPKTVSAPATAPPTYVRAAPIEPPAPRPVEAAVAAPPREPNPGEPLTFSFGGAKLAMGDNPKRPESAVTTVLANTPATPAGGMSSAKSMIIGFAVSAAVLGLAFYLITR
jgi:Double zinc ribbon